jgi:hypothetical protein
MKRREQKHLSKADRLIADATAQIAGLRSQITELEFHGSEFSAERDALDAFETHLSDSGRLAWA